MRTYPLSLFVLAVGMAAAQDQAPPPPPPAPERVEAAPTPPLPPAPPQQALELYRQASLRLHEKRFAEARELWDALATGFPKESFSAEARYWRARCLEHLGQFGGARDGYSAILAEPNSGWVGDAREGLARLSSGPGHYRVELVVGEPLSGRLHAIEPEHVQVWVEGAAKPKRMRWVEVKQVVPVAEAGLTRVVLVSGDRLTGTIVKATPEWVELECSGMGAIKLPHAAIKRLDTGALFFRDDVDAEVLPENGMWVHGDEGEDEDVEVIETPDGKRVVIKRVGGHDGHEQNEDVEVIEGPDGKRVVIKRVNEGHDDHDRGHNETVEEIVTPDGKRVVIKRIGGHDGHEQNEDVEVIEGPDGKRVVIKRVNEGHDDHDRGHNETVEEIVTPDGKRVVIKRIGGHDGHEQNEDVEEIVTPDGKRVVIKRVAGHEGPDGERETVEEIVTPDGKRIVIKRVGDAKKNVWVERDGPQVKTRTKTVTVVEGPDGKPIVIEGKGPGKRVKTEVIVIEREDHEGRPGVVFVPGDDEEDHVMLLRQGEGKQGRRLVLRQAREDGKRAKVRAVMVMGDDEDDEHGERFEFEFDGVDLEDLENDEAWRELPIKIRKEVQRALRESKPHLDQGHMDEALRDMEEALRDIPRKVRKRVVKAGPAKRVYAFGGKDGNHFEHDFTFDTHPFQNLKFGGGDFAFGAAQRGDQDRVFLDNGDVLSGQIESLDGSTLRLKASFGKVEIKRNQIARIVFKETNPKRARATRATKAFKLRKAQPARPAQPLRPAREARPAQPLRPAREARPTAPGQKRAFLGVGYEDADGGVRVTSIVPGSTAAQLLQVGDVLRSVNGKRLTSGEDLRQAMGGLKPGDSIQLEGSRNGGSFQIQTQIGSRPEPKDEDSSFSPFEGQTRTF